jgi:hypothetical protein
MPARNSSIPLRLEQFESRELPAATPWNLALGYNDQGVGKVRYMETQYTVKTFATGDQLDYFAPLYPSQELRVAVGDVNRDGINDIITANGPNITARSGPSVFCPATVRIFDGATLPGPLDTGTNGPRLIAGFVVPWKVGGSFVAAGDLDGDGYAEVVAGRDIRQIGTDLPKGPNQVAVYSGRDLTNLAPASTPTPRAAFMGIEDPNWWGGTPVGVGDVSGDGRADVVVSTGHRGGPRTAVWDGPRLVLGGLRKVCVDFFAADTSDRSGITLAVTDMNRDGYAEVLAGAQTGVSRPFARVHDGRGLATGVGSGYREVGISPSIPISELVGGLRLAVKDFNGDKIPDVAMSHLDGMKVSLYQGIGRVDTVPLLMHLDPFAPALVGMNHGGVWVG